MRCFPLFFLINYHCIKGIYLYFIWYFYTEHLWLDLEVFQVYFFPTKCCYLECWLCDTLPLFLSFYCFLMIYHFIFNLYSKFRINYYKPKDLAFLFEQDWNDFLRGGLNLLIFHVLYLFIFMQFYFIFYLYFLIFFLNFTYWSSFFTYCTFSFYSICDYI